MAEQLDCEKDSEVSWSSWIAWKSIEKYWDRRKEALYSLSLEKGLATCIKPIQTYRGKKHDPSRYFFSVVDIPSEFQLESLETISDREQVAPDTANYTKHMDVKLTWCGRVIFKNSEMQFKGWGGRMIRMGLVSSLLIVLILLIASYFAYGQSNEPLSSRFLIGVLITIAIPAFVWHDYWKPWLKLIHNRIIIASATNIALRDNDAQFELMRENDNVWIQVVRYTAPCPICGATLSLAEGEPEFPNRIVGRCSESPCEHIYSFDRVTRKGNALRETAGSQVS